MNNQRGLIQLFRIVALQRLSWHQQCEINSIFSHGSQSTSHNKWSLSACIYQIK